MDAEFRIGWIKDFGLGFKIVILDQSCRFWNLNVRSQNGWIRYFGDKILGVRNPGLRFTIWSAKEFDAMKRM